MFKGRKKAKMQNNWKRGIASILVLALIVTLCFGCAKEEEEVVTVVIGELTDLTGPAAIPVLPIHHAMMDLVRYYNEEGLIPGVKLRLATYDTRLDPARTIPGWDWVRERGAEVIYAILPQDAEMLKPFGEREKVVITTSSTSRPVIEPPGWAFSSAVPFRPVVKTLLKWVSEEHWDYTKGIPKLGYVGWRVPDAVDEKGAISEYYEAHPEEFDYIGGFLPPSGTMGFGSEAAALKDCDYIFIDVMAGPWFMRDFHDRGFDAQFIGGTGVGSMEGFFVEMVGWEGVDGLLSLELTRQWDEPYPLVDVTKELLYRYHPDEAEEIIRRGSSYVGGFPCILAFFKILEKAIEEVGAENFDGQAYYDAAVKFEMQLEGCPKWYFTETRRYMADEVALYKWSAEAEARVRITDWLPIVIE